MINTRKKLGDLLVDAGLIDKAQLNNALKLQKRTGKKLGELLVAEGLVNEKQIMNVLSEQLSIPLVNLYSQNIEVETAKLIPENLARKHTLLPIKRVGKTIYVAMADPLNIYAIDDIRIATGLKVEPLIATRKEILFAIEKHYGKESAERAVEDFKNQYRSALAELDEVAATDELSDAPLVRLINSLLQQAVKNNASDIHIEPFEHYVRIRFRIDGDLQEVMTPSKSTLSAIVTRIKIMARLDIAEKRLPQDGRAEVAVDGKVVDLRIAILPTIYGEKVVIRLLDTSNFSYQTKDLGFSEENSARLEKLLKQPTGIILVTGPTGSGKTTTLYAGLMGLNEKNRNIVTIEDPVEYRIEGINQIQVNNKTNLTFATGLRSILRQDPDIIMVGEIRDTETAQIAVRAAITGHLVLSTMHTNNTVATVTNLMDRGIEPYLIASSVIGVVAQRLVKKICPYCKTKYLPDETERKLLNINKNREIHKGTGCQQCNNTGYLGRTTIAEVLVISKAIRQMISKKQGFDAIKEKAVQEGMITLQESCIDLVLSGVTTVEELIRNTLTVD